MGCGASSGGAVGAKIPLTQELADLIKELFKKMDDDGNGSVTKEEAKKFFKGAFKNVSANAMFNEVDTDINGNISESEFLGFWQQVKDCGYKEDDIMEEVKTLIDGGTWVDWKDDRSVGQTKDKK
mmetsp:Transcript_3386/g.6979  ORF Transcript_3386/g.6979 Transcript_3386/m.6979 type:complete len:125 (+) Transcript_3386:101-475(+)